MSGEKLSKDARARLDAMCQTTDGFQLAELDMKLRGSGDLNGTQQSGMAFELKIANPVRDTQIVELTKRIAEEILAADPQLVSSANRPLQELKARYASHEKRDFSMIS